jgi:GNAT superfamily N-acetyltransferase
VHVRAAGHGDAVALVALFEHWGHPQTADQVSAILTMWSSTPFSRVLVAEDDNRLVGMAAISASPCLADFGRNATLACLVVAAEQRRKGVGRLLLAAAEDLARSWGCVRLELTCRGPATQPTRSTHRTATRRPPSGRHGTYAPSARPCLTQPNGAPPRRNDRPTDGTELART